MRTGYIYVITNNINGKQYVGKTTANPENYWNWHQRKAKKYQGKNRAIYNAINKYGVENFSFEVLEIYREDQSIIDEILNEREQYYILKLNTYGKGYNMTLGGDGVSGLKRTEEFKEKLRLYRTGKKHSEETIQKMRKPKTEEHKAKLRRPKSEEQKEKQRTKWREKTPEQIEAINRKILESRRSYSGEGNPFYGKTHTEKTKELIREKNTEYQNRPEVKIKNKKNQPGRIEAYAVTSDRKTAYHFVSLRDAGRWIKINTQYSGDVSTISKAVKNNKKSCGYQWYSSLEGVETIERVIKTEGTLL